MPRAEIAEVDVKRGVGLDLEELVREWHLAWEECNGANSDIVGTRGC